MPRPRFRLHVCGAAPRVGQVASSCTEHGGAGHASARTQSDSASWRHSKISGNVDENGSLKALYKYMSASKAELTLLDISWNTNVSAWGYLHVHCRKTPIHSPSNRRPHWLSACLPCRSLAQMCINIKLEKKHVHAEGFTKLSGDAIGHCWMSNAESYRV